MKRLLVFLVLMFAGVLQAQELSKPTSSVLPSYPEKARQARVTGVVKLWFVLNEGGAVSQAEVISGHPMLAQSALQDVKSWKFAAQSARPNTRYETEFVYNLDAQMKKGAPKLTVTLADFRRVEVNSELYVEAIE